jgi:hypothetical protein
MLLLGSSFAKFPILSLRSGTTVGSVVGHLINPHKLKIDALWCKVPNSKAPMLLLQQDIREVSIKGIIVDDSDVIVHAEDMVRLKPIINLRFELLEKRVISGRLPIGRVVDYALERDGLTVQKLYVEPNIFGRLKASRITIDRSLIIEVSPKHVKVRGGEVKDSVGQKVARQSRLSPAASSLSASDTEE